MITQEQVEKLKAQYAAQEAQGKAQAENGGTGARLNVSAYLTAHGVEHGTKINGAKTLFTLAHCIFNPDHGPNEASIGQGADGKLFYQCFHAGCKGRTWREARQIISGAASMRDFMEGGHYEQAPKIEQPGPPSRKAPEWPAPLAPEAFHGPAGEFVQLIEPHTEADPAALLVQFLTSFGNVVGRNSFFTAEADRHYPNLFAVIVGDTSKGRKGSSFGQIKRVVTSIDEIWPKRVKTGLASGEGLIWQVRDPIMGRVPIKEKGRVTGYDEMEIDPGEQDKRLLTVEPEFAGLLRVASRDGSIVSPLLRLAWDSGNLERLTTGRSASPIKATGAHISMVGHITKDELRRTLDRTEAGNGFANRFLWCCVRRSKCLPEGGKAHEVNLNSLLIRLRDAVVMGHRGEIKREDGARGIWANVYPSLSEGKPGLFGAVTSRAEAQVMRLALVYALLDQSATICKEHLLAALAVWDYCEASAKYIFGDAVGNPIADQIIAAMKNSGEGMTRTDISNSFGRHRTSDQIDRTLSDLASRGLIKMERIETQGRPVERWILL